MISTTISFHLSPYPEMFTMTGRKIQLRHVCELSLAEEDFLDNDAMWTMFHSGNSLSIFTKNFQQYCPCLTMEWKLSPLQAVWLPSARSWCSCPDMPSVCLIPGCPSQKAPDGNRTGWWHTPQAPHHWGPAPQQGTRHRHTWAHSRAEQETALQGGYTGCVHSQTYLP